ncbi:hypothetical protein [Pedobacter sp. Hv1]|uniref:hypothetical protein n=1 Tax=Pedobacter sp. Hv1 TaxID=1740090 RepID=UPI0006D88B77|nr:hypothetical protein [Pedobacter sp. Hv1]KQC02077.1 hypothetical protein AQF98_00450 [Pedobacter sp. Hv1]
MNELLKILNERKDNIKSLHFDNVTGYATIEYFGKYGVKDLIEFREDEGEELGQSLFFDFKRS